MGEGNPAGPGLPRHPASPAGPGAAGGPGTPARPGRLGAHLRLLRHLTAVNFQSALEYRVSFLMQVVFMALNNAVFLGFWWLFFETFDDVEGWKITQVFEVYGLTAIAFGLVHSVFGGLSSLGEAIAAGRLDQALSQPKAPLLKLMASRASPPALGDIFFGVGLLVGFTPLTWADIPRALFLATLGGSVLLHTGVILQSLAFWLGRSSKLAETLQNAVLTFGLYPEDLFGGPLKTLLYVVIPAGFVAWIPARLLKAFDPSHAALFAAFCLGYAAFAWRVFAWGLARYESGNQMVVNV